MGEKRKVLVRLTEAFRLALHQRQLGDPTARVRAKLLARDIVRLKTTMRRQALQQQLASY